MITSKGEASKNKLIAAAEELFASKGVHAATISQIVAQAGLTQAAFYLYFKSKEELLTELLDRFERELFVYTNAGSQVKELPLEQVEEYVIDSLIRLFQLFGKNINLTRIVLQETTEGERLRTNLTKQIAANMQANQEAGLVSLAIEPELFAEAIVAAVERLLYRYGISGEKTAEELGRQVGRLFLHGLLNEQPSSSKTLPTK